MRSTGCPSADQDRLEYSQRRVRPMDHDNASGRRGRTGARARAGSRTSTPAAAATPLALAKASCTSPSGEESDTTPPPTPSQIRDPARSNVLNRHVQFQSSQRGAQTDRPAIGLPGRRLELMDDTQDLHLRRAGDRAWRKGGAQQRVVSRLRAECSTDRRDQVPDSRRRLHLGQPGDPHRPVLAHSAQVVAHQVDDHHVLGPVLGAGGQVLRRAAARSRPLDRPGLDRSPAATQEQLGRQAGHSMTVAGYVGGVRRFQFGCRADPKVEQIAVERTFEAQADVGLEHLAVDDSLDRLGDRRRVTDDPGRRHS